MNKELEYRLTKDVKIHGWSCKLGQNDLTDLLTKVGLAGDIKDAAIIPIPNSDLVLVKNVDIFTPIIDEPEIAGEIAACNVTNDIFAMNVPEISGMLVFLAISTRTPMKVAEGILRGIKRFMEEKINSRIVGGHTIYSEWPLMGGEASGYVNKDTIIQTMYALMFSEHFNPSNTVIIVKEGIVDQFDLPTLKKFSAIFLIQGSISENSALLLKSYLDNGGILLPNIVNGSTSITQDEVEKLLDSFKGDYKNVDEISYTFYRSEEVYRLLDFCILLV